MISINEIKGREDKLRAIKRFSLFPVMFYRPDLFIHSKRVSWIVEELIPYAEKAFGSSFDANKARVLSLVHDDAEIITGDYQYGVKIKMSAREIEEIEKEEERAIEILSEHFPEEIEGYSYKGLLLHALRKDCIEAQLVSFADKFDAFGDVLNELYSGNKVFLKGVQSGTHGITEAPLGVHTRVHNQFKERFDELAPLFDEDCDFVKEARHVVDPEEEILKNGKPHDFASFFQRSGHLQYDLWKQTILKYATEEELKEILTPKELFTK